MLTRRSFTVGVAASATSAGRAQMPSAPVGTIIVPFSAGSQADLFARKYASLVADAATPHVIENAPGAGGSIAVRALLRRPADGRTLLLGTSGIVCSTPLLARPPVEYDTTEDLVPACIFAGSPFVMFAGKDFPAGNLDELQRLARAQVEPLSYASADPGSANHVAAEVLFDRMGIRGTHIGYRNNQQAYLDVSEGRVQLGVYGYSNVAPLVKAGKAKIIAVMGDRPLSVEPQLPTVPSQGWGRFDLQGWYGLFLAKGTPPALVSDHERQMQSALSGKGYADFLVQAGQEPGFRGRAEARSFIQSEVARYRATLQRLKLI